MALDFNKFAAKGNEFIKELANQLGHPEDKAKAGRILKVVLHAIRNRITVEENMQFMSQLPMFLKAVYVDGWKISPKPDRIKHPEDFFKEVKALDQPTGDYDFPDDDATENAVITVFIVLRNYVSLGELEDITAQLPKELKYLVGSKILMV